MRLFRGGIAIVLWCLVACLHAAEPMGSGPWDVERILNEATPPQLGEVDGLVTAIHYPSEPYHGHPTRVFAYYGRPKGQGPFPAMLLVHGGGGKAFAEWAQLWAERGYVALAMDLAGHGPDGQALADGGPPQDDQSKFRAFGDSDLRDMWSYQAVAAVLRGHALLIGRQQDVDPERIGITGISWGGYLTCIVAGIDARLKVAVPVYGCGFLGDNSHWQEQGTFDRMTPDGREWWLKNFDPSQYLAGVRATTLFVNGTNDFAYPLDSYQKCYRLVAAPRTLCVTVNMPHSHPDGWAPKEIGAFVDSVLKGGVPLPQLSKLQISYGTATATFETASPIAKAELHYTTDAGRWQDRTWKTLAIQYDAAAKRILAPMPSERPLTCFVTLTDERGLTVSTEHVDVGVR